MNRFENKVVLVTGGASGMGLEIAEFFAQEGAKVCICGRDPEKGKEAVEAIKRNGFDILFFTCDITNADAIKKMIEEIVLKYKKLDFAINNAGITAKYGMLAESSEENWQTVININLIGTYLCMKYEVIQMLKNNGGVIINNSSLSGLMPHPGQSAYVTSKHAICALTKAAALEYANTTPCIRINAIAPGPIIGGMNTEEKLKANPEKTQAKINAVAMKRFGKPEEVANTVLWLCSDEAAFITGVIIPIDGGGHAGKW